MKHALLPGLVLLTACGAQEPERGAGVYPLAHHERQARQEAQFRAGEKMSLDDLRRALRALGLHKNEIAEATDPDHGIRVLRLAITPPRLAGLDVDALARLKLDSNYRLEFTDEAVARAIAKSDVLYRRETAAEIAIVKAHGDWERIPRLRAGESMASLARRLEDWCDFDPGGALRVIDGRWLEYAHAPVDIAVREPVPGRATDRFDCLRRTVYATQLRGYFIGYRGAAPPAHY